MVTTDEMVARRTHYRHRVENTLTLGGLPHLVPHTEREWLLFGVNQMARDQGVGKPLPWPDQQDPSK